MKAIVLYRPNTERARGLEAYVQDFKRFYPNKALELIDVDSAAGVDKARLYDAVDYPAVLAVTDDGQLLKMWQGGQLPLINELAVYADGRPG